MPEDFRNQFSQDISEVISGCHRELELLLRGKVLVTGGGGFVGRWLVTTLANASHEFSVSGSVTSLSRTTPKWQADLVKDGLLSVVNHDLRYPLQISKEYSCVFHCAVPASAELNVQDPELMQSTIEEGTQNVINHFEGTKARIVNVSSGAVYGTQPPDKFCLEEEWVESPLHQLPESAYHRGKFNAEKMLNASVLRGDIDAVHARLFAFLAPHLPLDSHFAAGNFLSDAKNGRRVRVRGDGRTLRSYMYGTDLAIWLFKVAVSGQLGRSYNIGSPFPVSIFDLAQLVTAISGCPSPVDEIAPADSGVFVHRYIPCTHRIERELGVRLSINLEQAIRRTLKWLRET